MKISALEEYGLRCLVQLAREGAGPESEVSLSARQIAEREALTAEYAAQILSALRRAGLVTSTRGVHGGFRLARAPREITVGQLFRELDGALTDGLCDSYTGTLDVCTHQAGCHVRSVWSELARRIYGFLDRVSVADIAGGTIETTPAIVPLESLRRR